MMTIREKLAQKTMRIEEIKGTLKKSQLLKSRQLIKNSNGTIQADDNIIDEVVKQFEENSDSDL